MTTLFRFLNPLHWFRDKQFDFLEKQMDNRSIFIKSARGVDEKVMRKQLYKFFGKKGEYLRPPISTALGKSDGYNIEDVTEAALRDRYGSTWKIYGKGAKYARTLTDKVGTILNGWEICALYETEDSLHWLHNLVYPALILYRDATGTKIKGFPEECPYCHSPYTNRHIPPPVVVIDIEQEADFMNELGGYTSSIDCCGMCSNCGQEILDYDWSTSVKLFKRIWKAEKQTGLRFFDTDTY